MLEEYFRCFCLAKAQVSQAIIEGEKIYDISININKNRRYIISLSFNIKKNQDNYSVFVYDWKENIKLIHINAVVDFLVN